jgi:peroxiredoxin
MYTLSLLAALVVVTSQAQSAEKAPAAEKATSTEKASEQIGRQIEGFELKDFRGKTHALSDFDDKKLVVVAFLGTECPLVKLYSQRLNELADAYASKGVVLVGINSNRQDSITELEAFARRNEFEFPLLKDVGNQVADQFGAKRTPEMFVLDQDRVIHYRGRIDDQYGYDKGVGYQKASPQRRDLAEALDELLAGKAVSKPLTEARGCIIGRVREANPDSEVTYSNQIARLFQDRCVKCHREGEIAPFAMTTYEEVAGWAEMINEVVQDQRMPPWHADIKYGKFLNDAHMSDEEKELIATWVRNGSPEGDPAQLPEPEEFTEGWMMPYEPDMVVHMRDEPFKVSAEGVVEYQYFVVDPGFTEDKWVKVAECRADDRAVVHHIIVFVRPPVSKGADSGDRDVRGFNFLAGFAPGTRPFEYPEGMAKRIPAGSKLVFQLHYTPVGSERLDRSYVGLKFVDPSEVKYQVATTNATNAFFRIPPGDDNHEVVSQRRFTRDSLLLSLYPHMHLRGKSFKYTAAYPDGTEEILLDVPRYDFNWQNHFILTEPKLMPKGTLMKCVAHFDNSEDNLANPDPKSEVMWGDQTWEEMMIGWYDIAIPLERAQELQEQDAPANDSDSDSDSDNDAD